MSKVLKSIEDKADKQVEWEPGSLLDKIDGLDLENFVYRWVLNDPVRISNKSRQGWVVCSSIEGDDVEHLRPNSIDTGAARSSSLTEYREVVLMKLPVKSAEARAKYFENKTKEQKEQIKRNLRDTLRGAEITGDISSSKTVIN